MQVFHVRDGRIRGQRGWVVDEADEGGTRRAGAATSSSSSTAGEDADVDPARGAGAGPAARRRRAGAAGSASGGGAGSRSASRSAATSATLPQTVARNAAQALALHKTQAGQRPDHPQPGARGDPAGAGPRRGAAADRVLRRLQPPGHRGRRLDGRLRGRPVPQERVPAVRDPRRRRPERRRVDARGDHPAVPAAARRSRASADVERDRSSDERPAASAARRPGDRPPAASSPTRPSLVVVDGGPPQVAAAQQALAELGINDVARVRAGQAARGGVAAGRRRTR